MSIIPALVSVLAFCVYYRRVFVIGGGTYTSVHSIYILVYVFDLL